MMMDDEKTAVIDGAMQRFTNVYSQQEQLRLNGKLASYAPGGIYEVMRHLYPPKKDWAMYHAIPWDKRKVIPDGNEWQQNGNMPCILKDNYTNSVGIWDVNGPLVTPDGSIPNDVAYTDNGLLTSGYANLRLVKDAMVGIMWPTYDPLHQFYSNALRVPISATSSEFYTAVNHPPTLYGAYKPSSSPSTTTRPQPTSQPAVSHRRLNIWDTVGSTKAPKPTSKVENGLIVTPVLTSDSGSSIDNHFLQRRTLQPASWPDYGRGVSEDVTLKTSALVNTLATTANKLQQPITHAHPMPLSTIEPVTELKYTLGSTSDPRGKDQARTSPWGNGFYYIHPRATETDLATFHHSRLEVANTEIPAGPEILHNNITRPPNREPFDAARRGTSSVPYTTRLGDTDVGQDILSSWFYACGMSFEDAYGMVDRACFFLRPPFEAFDSGLNLNFENESLSQAGLKNQARRSSALGTMEKVHFGNEGNQEKGNKKSPGEKKPTTDSFLEKYKNSTYETTRTKWEPRHELSARDRLDASTPDKLKNLGTRHIRSYGLVHSKGKDDFCISPTVKNTYEILKARLKKSFTLGIEQLDDNAIWYLRTVHNADVRAQMTVWTKFLAHLYVHHPVSLTCSSACAPRRPSPLNPASTVVDLQRVISHLNGGGEAVKHPEAQSVPSGGSCWVPFGLADNLGSNPNPYGYRSLVTPVFATILAGLNPNSLDAYASSKSKLSAENAVVFRRAYPTTPTTDADNLTQAIKSLVEGKEIERYGKDINGNFINTSKVFNTLKNDLTREPARLTRRRPIADDHPWTSTAGEFGGSREHIVSRKTIHERITVLTGFQKQTELFRHCDQWRATRLLNGLEESETDPWAWKNYKADAGNNVALSKSGVCALDTQFITSMRVQADPWNMDISMKAVNNSRGNFELGLFEEVSTWAYDNRVSEYMMPVARDAWGRIACSQVYMYLTYAGVPPIYNKKRRSIAAVAEGRESALWGQFWVDTAEYLKNISYLDNEEKAKLIARLERLQKDGNLFTPHHTIADNIRRVGSANLVQLDTETRQVLFFLVLYNAMTWVFSEAEQRVFESRRRATSAVLDIYQKRLEAIGSATSNGIRRKNETTADTGRMDADHTLDGNMNNDGDLVKRYPRGWCNPLFFWSVERRIAFLRHPRVISLLGHSLFQLSARESMQAMRQSWLDNTDFLKNVNGMPSTYTTMDDIKGKIRTVLNVEDKTIATTTPP